jgi:hypothetical protein
MGRSKILNGRSNNLNGRSYIFGEEAAEKPLVGRSW